MHKVQQAIIYKVWICWLIRMQDHVKVYFEIPIKIAKLMKNLIVVWFPPVPSKVFERLIFSLI